MQFPRTICWLPTACEAALEFLSTCTLIAADVETIPFKKSAKNKTIAMTVVSYTGVTNDWRVASFAFPLQRDKSISGGVPTYIDVILDTCRRINDLDIPFCGQNFMYDAAWFMRYHMPVRNWAYDSMIMWWAIYPELPKTLDFISSILVDHYQYWKAARHDDDYINYMNYAMSDTEMTLLCVLKLMLLLKQDSRAYNNFMHAHMRCVIGLSMSMKGLRVNLDTLNGYNQELSEVAKVALEKLRYLVANPEFNPNSPKQKVDLIYGVLGAKPRNAKGKFVKKLADASAGAIALRAIRNEHPVFRRVVNAILGAIEPAKQISNVIGIPFILSPSSGKPRLITAYDGVGTTTTRYSSRSSAYGFGTNNQNIRKDYRGFAEADEESVYFEIDLSAADDVFVSFESQEQKKIDLFRSGRDIHASNALIFFSNWTYESIIAGKKAKDERVVHPITGVRQITKKVVHGNHYLMAAHTLFNTAGRDAIVAAAKEQGHADSGQWAQQKLVDFCEHLENLFRNHYPRFKRSGEGSWYQELRQEAIDTRGFYTIFHYFQRFLGNPHDDAILRAVAASAGQANTAGRINMALEELILGHRTLMFRDGPAPDANDDTRMVSEELNGISLRQQTHDSAGFNIKLSHPRWQEGIENIFHVFRRPVFCKGEVFSVGVEADVSYRWGGKESQTIDGYQGVLDFVEKFPSRDLRQFDAEAKLKKSK